MYGYGYTSPHFPHAPRPPFSPNFGREGGRGVMRAKGIISAFELCPTVFVPSIIVR